MQTEKICEYRRKCNQCGKVWHSLVEREQEIGSNLGYSKCQNCVHCCDTKETVQLNRNELLEQSELDRLKSCPECHSKDYTEKEVCFEKKE